MKKLTADKCRDFLQSIESVRATYGSICIKDAYFKEALEIALPILEQHEKQEQQERGEWIEWKGGGQPVNGDVLVETKWSDGSVSRGEASDWRWDHRSLLSNLNLIAYRIIPERATNQNGEQ